MRGGGGDWESCYLQAEGLPAGVTASPAPAPLSHPPQVFPVQEEFALGLGEVVRIRAGERVVEGVQGAATTVGHQVRSLSRAGGVWGRAAWLRCAGNVSACSRHRGYGWLPPPPLILPVIEPRHRVRCPAPPPSMHTHTPTVPLPHPPALPCPSSSPPSPQVSELDSRLRISERASAAGAALRESAVAKHTSAALGRVGSAVSSTTKKVCGLHGLGCRYCTVLPVFGGDTQ